MITTPLLALVVILGLVLITMNVCLRRAFFRFRIRKNYTAALEAPSVSVCIPARNETHAMTQCLERVLASDYRKMEVIVYDDESKDDTSILIRSFAHAGVRFVPGEPLPEGWLGKNHALEVLAREASGTFVIFMDVDTHIKPTTVSQLVGYMMTEQAEMLSVIPGREDAWRLNVLFGHLRYFWELILSRASSPATASSLWMIRRQSLLETYGGFAPIKQYVAPESRLASLLTYGKYRCLVNNATLGVSYEKKWLSQLETGRRLLYPMVGGRPLSGLLFLLILLLLNVPTVLTLAGLFTGWSVWTMTGAVFLVAFMLTYMSYAVHMLPRSWWTAGLVWPVVIVQELLVMLTSSWGYARHTITWKGRPVTARQPRRG